MRPGPAKAAVFRVWFGLGRADWKSPVAVLIGNEGAGLPEEIIESCDARVSIPQRESGKTSGVESLNAAMAGSVLLYEAMRQRGSCWVTVVCHGVKTPVCGRPNFASGDSLRSPQEPLHTESNLGIATREIEIWHLK